MAIDLTSYEKRSLYRFLIIYLGSVFMLLAVIGFLFCKKNSNSITTAKRFEMLYQARMLESRLLMAEEKKEKDINKTLLPKLVTKNFKVGYYDKDKNPIFTQIKKVPKFDEEFYGFGKYCYSIVKFPGNSLDVKYIVLQEDELKKNLHTIKSKVILFVIYVCNNDNSWLLFS